METIQEDRNRDGTFAKGNQVADKGKRFLGALARAIAQDDGARLRQAAEALLTQAAKGEQWAVKELRDTLDGRPSQATELSGKVEVHGRLVING